MSKEKIIDDIKEKLKPFGNKHNILLIMADEFRFPIHKDIGGMDKDFKNILGFQDVDNTQTDVKDYIDLKIRRLFPGFMKLRQNATVLKKHTVATTACVPSRSAMFTGQYGTKNKVTQTDGVFKGASEDGFSWLDPEGIPTVGHWFKENNYTTHYFGKCHFAHPKKQSLKRWGFDDWETSFPEPHGTLKNNLGMYRDHGFTDLVTTFLRRKGMALDYDQEVGKIEMNEKLSEEERQDEINKIEKKPWFAVASFTNPHDITTWPVLPTQAEKGKLDLFNGQHELDDIKNIKPLGIPKIDAESTPPINGSWTFMMNPKGMQQDCASLPNSWNEKLEDKPDCQYDYSLKLGIALAAKTGKKIEANNSALLTGMPLALSSEPDQWTEAYLQYYTYLHHVLDQQIDRVLQTLDDTGLRNDTIVVFVPDHGEYGGSHGQMMQKWHTAYQEAIHVPVVISMPDGMLQEDVSDGTPKAIEELTSHIDIAPTLLGLIGVNSRQVEKLRERLGGEKVPEFVGADLSDLITGKENKIQDRFNINEDKKRDAILFTTSDMITEPISRSGDSLPKPEDYQLYLRTVDNYIKNKHVRLSDEQWELTKRMKPGSVIQPAEVHCVREEDWKLVRYRDYYNPYDETKFQWELYNLESDPGEESNLLVYKTEPNEPRFKANTAVIGNVSLTADAIVEKAEHLYRKMLLLIDKML